MRRNKKKTEKRVRPTGPGSPGIWKGLPGSELDGEWGKVALLPLPGELGKLFPGEWGKAGGMVLAWGKDSGKVAFCGMCGSFCCRGLRKRGSIVCLALNSLFLGTNTGGSTERRGRERERSLETANIVALKKKKKNPTNPSYPTPARRQALPGSLRVFTF